MKNKGRWIIGSTVAVLVILFGILVYMVAHPIIPVVTKADVVEALKERASDLNRGKVQIAMEASYQDWGTVVDWSYYADTEYEYQPESAAMHTNTSGNTSFSEAQIDFTKESYHLPQGSSFTSYTNDSHNAYGWIKENNVNAGVSVIDFAKLLLAFGGEKAGFQTTETTYILSVILATDELEAVIGGSKPFLNIGLETVGASFDSSMYEAVVELEAEKETHTIVKISVRMKQGLKSTFAVAGRELTGDGSMTLVYRPDGSGNLEISLPQEVSESARTVEEIRELEEADYAPENELEVRGKYPLYNENATMAVGINKPSDLMLSYEDYYLMSFSDFELYYEIKFWIKEKKAVSEYTDAYINERITSIEGNELLERKAPGQFTVGAWEVSYESLVANIADVERRQHIACADIGADSTGKEWCLYVEAFEIPVNGRYRYSAEQALKKAYRVAKK